MNPLNFLNDWTKQEDNLRRISLETLMKFDINISTQDFLRIAGLPDSCAPFLSFVEHNPLASPIEKLNKIYDLDETYQNYIVIGSDSAGNPIVINTEADCVIQRLDHEMDFTEEFMNSSINQLAHFLLLYRDFVSSVQELNGEDAFLNCQFSDAQYEGLINSLKAADGRAVIEGFWCTEIQGLLLDREYYKINP